MERIFSLISKLSKAKAPGLNVEVPVPDFIPYACHWDADTILTKNGELLQIIKVTGFTSESVGSEDLDLREVIRKAVKDNIKSDDFALWFHTVRRKRNLDPGGDFPAGFSDELNKAWKTRHSWDETYVNEVYVTIIRDGCSAKITDFASMLRSLYFGILKKYHESYLEESNKILSGVVDGMLETLKPFGARRLSVKEDKGVYYSDQLQFFAKILNLADVTVSMPVKDISNCIASHGIAVGFRTLEVRGRAGKKFGAIFSLKEYYELAGTSLDKVLQLPQEFIITQAVDFIDAKKALKTYKYQHYIFRAGRDEDLSRRIGLDKVVDSYDGSVTAFGNSQITLFLIDSNLEQLDHNIFDMSEALSNLGIAAPRRDLRLEECFWAQLPANFAHISRQKPISTSLVAGFASLYNCPAGKRFGNLWGPAVTMFHTVMETPYFFSFHVGDNGHTAILGPRGMGKTVLVNFMVSESRKFNGRLFFFDQERASKVFISSMGGFYTIIKPDEPSPSYAFNPLNIPDSPENREFLKEWIVLLAESGGDKASDKEKEHLAKLVDYIYTVPEGNRRLSTIAESFGEVKKGSLGARMSIWHGEGKYAHLFDNDRTDIIAFDELIYGFGMSYLVDDKVALYPVLAYLLHRIEMLLDGEPTMIVLDEAWNLVNNQVFAPKMADWLERMKQKNAVVIFATETVPNDSTNSMTNTVSKAIATQIFLPNPDASESSTAYTDVWGLTDEEFDTLSKMRIEKRQFMLKQSGESIVATLDLGGLKEVNVLSGGDKTVIIMEDAIKEKGDSPEDWLPALYEKMDMES